MSIATQDISPPDALPRPLRWLLGLSSAVVLITFFAVAFYHRADSFLVNHVSGVWIGLAYHASQGVIYPEVYDGQLYGGSRYMPLYFLAHAGLASVTEEYLLSGKVLSFLGALACGIVLYQLLWTQRCPQTIALALVSLVAASVSGTFGSLTIRGDLWPVTWQLAALALVHRQVRGAYVFAGILCTLGVLTKITALWAPAAILWYTLLRDRKACMVFGLTWLASLGLALGILHVLTAGRMLASFGAFTEPMLITQLLKSPFRLIYYIAWTSTELVVLTPLVIMELYAARGAGRWSVFHTALLFCLPVMLVVFADRGTGFNHVIDLVVLAAVIVGMLWSSGKTAVSQAVLTMGAITVLWGVGAAWTRSLANPTRDMARAIVTSGDDSPYPALPLASVLTEPGPMLCEDARVAIAHGQAPVVLDPYALPFLERNHPDWLAALLKRIERHEFQYIVLQYRLDLDPRVNDGWYDIIFGPTVSSAIRDHYRFHAEKDGFVVLVARTGK